MRIIDIKAFEGRNIYCHRPVVLMTLDLEEFSNTTTADLDGFLERLLSTVPSLSSHHCSAGEPGGFVTRVKRGTYLGHVVEHLALELQALLGNRVIYGKTRLLQEPGTYAVIYEYECRPLALEAGRVAVNLVSALARQQPFNLDPTIEHLRKIYYSSELGPSTRAIAQAARARGIPVIRLNEGSLLQLGYGAYQKRVLASLTSSTGCIAADIASDKLLTKRLLREMGIPVPAGGVATEESELEKLAEEFSYPLVVKPLDGNQGRGVSLNLTSLEELQKAFRIAKKYSSSVIVEKHIPGRHYRILVVGRQVVAVSEKIPAHVVGDGLHTISQLVELTNSHPRRGEHHEKPLTKIRIDEITLAVLARHGLTPEDIPAAGEVIYLRESANLSTGGVAIDATDEIHPANSEFAIRAAEITGLDVAGVDVVASHISVPISAGTGAVIEVNACPGLRMHLYPSRGMPRDVAGAIVDHLFPKPVESRIPIVAVTGTNGKTTVARMISHVLAQRGLTVGLACTDGIYMGHRKIRSGDCSGAMSAKHILMDPRAEAGVLEVARGGIIKEGLGFDTCDVAVVTNLAGDHLGQDGVETLEDLAFVKSLVVESVKRDGFVVLNADDPASQLIVSRASAPIIYYSRRSDNILIHRHVSQGGKAVVLQKGRLYLLEAKRMEKLFTMRSVPACLNGRLPHNVDNLLAATAACLGLGLPAEDMAAAFRTFKSDPLCNPGRFNLFQLDNGAELIVDYGHNPPALRQALPAARGFCRNSGRLFSIVACPGDRRDEDIRMLGRVSGELSDYVIIKEDKDLRGRTPGETASLIRQGVIDSGLSIEKCWVEPDEEAAIRRALTLCKPGDVVILFYEKWELLMDSMSRCLPGFKIAHTQGLEPVGKYTGATHGQHRVAIHMNSYG
ncbi:MAG TPA: cyanophycin synthetase [Firmicutes bacterium]|nr:cyanophycin synthetase [Bacillota bacterium]